MDETLAEAPKEAKVARELVETYLGRFSKKGYSRPATDEFGYVDEKAAAQVCADRDELTEVQKGDWKRPELTEPIAKTAELADEWLLACAGAKAGIEKSWEEARSLYESYLKTYASEPGAEQARQGRDQVVAQIEHKQDRANAVARANRPADGSNLGACRDGRCQVWVSPGDVITFGGPRGPYQVRADDIAGGALSVSLGGTIRSMASTGGSLVSGDGFATWSSGAEGELVLNDKVGLGVDGVRGNRATLSVWPAP